MGSRTSRSASRLNRCSFIASSRAIIEGKFLFSIAISNAVAISFIALTMLKILIITQRRSSRMCSNNASIMAGTDSCGSKHIKSYRHKNNLMIAKANLIGLSKAHITSIIQKITLIGIKRTLKFLSCKESSAVRWNEKSQKLCISSFAIFALSNLTAVNFKKNFSIFAFNSPGAPVLLLFPPNICFAQSGSRLTGKSPPTVLPSFILFALVFEILIFMQGFVPNMEKLLKSGIFTSKSKYIPVDVELYLPLTLLPPTSNFVSKVVPIVLIVRLSPWLISKEEYFLSPSWVYVLPSLVTLIISGTLNFIAAV